jgi:5-methylcytosine-specific restriction protein B
VQFHASYNYTDFVEGLKPAVIDGQHVFLRMDGIFKRFCRKAAKSENKGKKYFFVIDEINRADLSSVFGELMFCLEKDYRGEKGITQTQYHGMPTYQYIPQDGSVSDLFITNTNDSAGKIQDDIFAKGFYIPENVVIIGTMNDIDRNVETFDFALRRRFRWINIDANQSIKERFGATSDLADHAIKLNDAIAHETYLGEAFQLGQSYFSEFKLDENDYSTYFENELKPVLTEYLRGKKNAGDTLNRFKAAFENG